MNFAAGLAGLILGSIGLARVIGYVARLAHRARAAGARYAYDARARKVQRERAARDSDPRRLQAVATLALAEALAEIAKQAREARRVSGRP